MRGDEWKHLCETGATVGELRSDVADLIHELEGDQGPIHQDVFMEALIGVTEEVMASSEDALPKLATFQWVSKLSCSFTTCTTKAITGGLPPRTIASLVRLDEAKENLANTIERQFENTVSMTLEDALAKGDACTIQQICKLSRVVASEQDRLECGNRRATAKHLQTVLCPKLFDPIVKAAIKVASPDHLAKPCAITAVAQNMLHVVCECLVRAEFQSDGIVSKNKKVMPSDLAKLCLSTEDRGNEKRRRRYLVDKFAKRKGKLFIEKELDEENLYDGAKEDIIKNLNPFKDDTDARKATKENLAKTIMEKHLRAMLRVEDGVSIAVDKSVRPHLRRRWVHQIFQRVRGCMTSAAIANRQKVQACDVVNSLKIEAFEYAGHKGSFKGTPFDTPRLFDTPMLASPCKRKCLAIQDSPCHSAPLCDASLHEIY